jgi:hypothetical protein
METEVLTVELKKCKQKHGCQYRQEMTSLLDSASCSHRTDASTDQREEQEHSVQKPFNNEVASGEENWLNDG